MSLNRAAKVLARTRREIQRSKTRTSAFESSRALSCGCNVRRTEDSTPDIFTAALVATAAAGTLCSVSCTRENSACDAKRTFAPFQPLTSKAEPRRFKTMHQPRNVMLHRMRSAAGRGLNAKYKVDWKTVLGEGAYGSVHPARLAITGEKVSFNCDVTSASYLCSLAKFFKSWFRLMFTRLLTLALRILIVNPQVALKKISKRYTNSSTFRTETDALLRIYDNGGHPNISGLRDMYEDFSHFYLILDLIKGGEMFDHLINDGAYSEADAARLLFEIASALAFLHGVGVVHADLKPENLLLCSKNRRDGTIKLIDFGCAVLQPEKIYEDHGSFASSSSLSKASDSSNGSELQENGTTGYWPPERFNHEEITPAVDTWAVGVILYIVSCVCHPLAHFQNLHLCYTYLYLYLKDADGCTSL